MSVFQQRPPFWACLLGGLILALPAGVRGEAEDARFARLRASMVEHQIARPPDYRTPVRERHVLDVMRTVPRHLFVRPSDRDLAYGDHPIPIGCGQTISQPYIVALMTEMLRPGPEHRVLEVGTGSGYQAAVLSGLVREVYTVEIVEALGEAAARRLRVQGYDNVHVKVADGYFGWKEHAPFDRIVVTCAASMVPPPLVRQLRPGGCMCIPVGGQYAVQYLTLVHKAKDGRITMEKKLPVRFVPLTRRAR